MTQSSARRTFPQNPLLSSKDKLVSAAPTKSNKTPAVSRALTPAIAPPVVFALFFIAHYLENDF